MTAAVAVLLMLAGAGLVVARLTGTPAPAGSLAPASAVSPPDLDAPSLSSAPADPPAPAGTAAAAAPAAPAPNQAQPRRISQPAIPGDRGDGGRAAGDEAHGRRGHDLDERSPEEARARRQAADAVCDQLGLPRRRCESQAESDD